MRITNLGIKQKWIMSFALWLFRPCQNSGDQKKKADRTDYFVSTTGGNKQRLEHV
jgi:hypothetical protein